MSDVTIIALDLENKMEIKKLIKFVNTRLISPVIFVASSKKLNIKDENIQNFVFVIPNPDMALNALIKLVETDKLIVIRKISDLEDIEKVYRGLIKSNSICVLSKKSNKVTQFFQKLSDFVTNFLFGYKFLHAGLGVVGFSRVPLAVLKHLDNCSMYTKVDRWIGIEINFVQTNKVDKVKFKPKLTSNFLKLGVYTILALAPLLCWIFSDFVQRYVILQLLFAFLIILFVCLVVIQVIIICVKLKVGDNIHQKSDFKQNKRSKDGKSKNRN